MAKNSLFPCPFALPCDTFNCSQPARWFVGNPDGPLSVAWKLCDDCARSLLDNPPKELHPGPRQEAAETPGTPDPEPLACTCGRIFTGVTAKATFARHQKVCPTVNGWAKQSEGES